MPETRNTIWGNVAHNLSPVGNDFISAPYRAAMVGPYLGMVRKAKKANTWSDRTHRPIGPPPNAPPEKRPYSLMPAEGILVQNLKLFQRGGDALDLFANHCRTHT